MGDFLQKFNEISKQNVDGGTQPPDTAAADNALLSMLQPKESFNTSTSPADGPLFDPNAKYNVTDFSRINVDSEALNGYFTNAWNSFKRGIDSIQIATIQGKLNYSPLGDAPYETVDKYDDQLKGLSNQLDKGIINEAEYLAEKARLDSDYNNAMSKIAEGESDIASNEDEIRNEPVSKQFELKSYYTQLQGDSGSFLDKALYTMPQVMGSSASLMLPQLAATFGTNITKALIRSSVAYVAGPEAGVPANAIATVGAIAASLGEVLYGRSQESYGEVGSTIMEAQNLMKREYMQENNLTSEDQIPADVLKDIRVKSRAGADMQFKENMALAAVDIAQAILMPLSTLSGTIGSVSKVTQKAGELADTIRNYSKVSRVLTTAGGAAFNAMGEKFEEGFQYAAQKRAENMMNPDASFENKGLIGNILQDGYDTAASLNYSMIPGIDLRGGGKYSSDKEFQFSENSGALLGLVMSAVPTALSVAKDLRAYKQANQDLANNGILDVDSKIRRLNSSILKNYFDKDQAHHLEMAVKSLVGKKDENGNPMLTSEQANDVIRDMRESYAAYTSLSEKLERNIGKDRVMGVFGADRLRTAKEMVKEDMFNAVVNMRSIDRFITGMDKVRGAQLAFDTRLNPEATAYIDASARMEAIDEMIDAIGKQPMDAKLQARLDNLKQMRVSTDELIQQELKNLAGAGISQDRIISPSSELIDTHKQLLSQSLYKEDALEEYITLDKIKTKQDLFNYLNRAAHRPISEDSPLHETLRTVADFADRIKKGEQITDPEDLQFYENNKKEIEDLLGESFRNETKATPEEPANEDFVSEPNQIEDEEVADVIADDTPTVSDDELLDDLGNEVRRILDDSTMSEAKKAIGLRNFMAQLQVTGADATVPNVWTILSSLFPNDPDYIQGNFQQIHDLVRGFNPSEPNYKLDPVTMELYQPSVIPPVQTAPQAEQMNRDNLYSMFEDVENPKGTGNKIVSSLSVANAHIVGQQKKDLTWESVLDEQGKLQYNEADHQQLTNTSAISPGDELILLLESAPASLEDKGDENYDTAVIGIYKDIKNGSVTRRLRIGAMHTITGLDRLLANEIDGEPIDIEAQKEILRVNRRTIIEGGQGKVYSSTVASKGFGYFNFNSGSTTIKAAIGDDTRPRVSVIGATKLPVNLANWTIRAQRVIPKGTTVLMVPNDTNEGEVYVPVVLNKRKLGVDPAILSKVYKSVLMFLVNGDRKSLASADKYVYITRDQADMANVGLAGIYSSYSGGEYGFDNIPTITVNNQVFTPEKYDGLKEALAQTYFSANMEAIRDDEYQAEIMNSPLLQTNIAANPVLLERSNEYGDILGDDRYSYFSQHTITFTGISEVKEDIIAPEVETEAPIDESDAEDQLRDLGINLDGFDDIVPEDNSVDIADVRKALGLRPGNRFTEAELADIRTQVNKLNGTSSKYVLISSKSPNGTYAVHLHQIREYNFDDLSDGEIPGVPASIQHQMIDSLAYLLLNGRQTPGEDAVRNADLAKATIQKKVTAIKALLPSIKTPEKVEGYRKIMTMNQMMLDHYDALLAAAGKLLEDMGFKYNADTDYYENMEANIEETEAVQFDDDSNSTRDQKEFLPGDVKKLLYFIPAMRELDMENPADVEYFNKFNTPYRPKYNVLGMEYFNAFNDTWEKILSVTSSAFYSSSKSGMDKMINRLLDTKNPAVVQEVAKKLQKADEQVKNAFFRRTNLQNQKNVQLLHIIEDKSNVEYDDATGEAVSQEKGEQKRARIVAADRRQAEGQVLQVMEQEFRAANTGMLVREIEEATGREILVMNTDFAKELIAQLEDITSLEHLTDEARAAKLAANFKTNRQGIPIRFNYQARKQIYNIVLQAGIKMSYGAFADLIESYRIENVANEMANVDYLFKTKILGTLAGNKSTEEGKLKSYSNNNPFTKERETMSAVARMENKYRIQRQSGAYRLDQKSYYPYTRHNFLSEIFTQVTEYVNTNGKVDTFLKDKVTNDKFAMRSMYMNTLRNPSQQEFRKNFKLFYELGSRNISSNGDVKLLKDMTDREHQVTKLGMFQNSGRKAAIFMYDTLSDKSTKPLVQANRLNVEYDYTTNSGLIQLSDKNLDSLYNYFEAEYDRIKDVEQQNKNLEKHKLIKGYHDIGNKEGMGKYFNIYYFLNKDALAVTNPSLMGQMYNADGTLKPITGGVKQLIKNELNVHFNKLLIKHKRDFKALELYELREDQSKPEGFIVNFNDFLDKDYFSGTYSNRTKTYRYGLIEKLNLGNSDEVKDARKFGQYEKLGWNDVNRIIDYVIADYVFNFTIFSNEMLMFTGDPAQAGKLASKGELSAIKSKYKENPLEAARQTLIANIQSTYVNLGKRNAAFLGSGEKGMFQTEEYNVAIANDEMVHSPQLEEYKTRFKGNEAGIEDAYGNKEMTDAQEVTTVKEHLQVKMAYGDIDMNTYKRALYLNDRDAYRDEFGDSNLTFTQAERARLAKVVMQPMKPVQRTFTSDSELRISKQYYIKTSSYPLVPSMVAGTPLEALLKDMKAHKVDRVAFVSGVKQGVAGSKDMFNKEGQYNTQFLENNINTLSRDGFRIQLEVPYKEDKVEVREGTQMSKLLFVDIPDQTIVSLNGAPATVGALKEQYVELHRKIIEYKRRKLIKDMDGIETPTGEIVLKSKTKLSDMLIDEGKGRGYSQNALYGLELNEQGNFRIPLTFLPNAGQIEPVLTSIISNRIARLKMPGKSYVQGSEFVLKTGRIEEGTNLQDRRDIVWTKPEYAGMGKLNYMSVDGTQVRPAQIIMPFYFVADGKRVPVENYTIEKDGKKYIDATKIDPELIGINGFRIPFQGHNSGMWFEIVGFLPENMGDLVLVPGEIAGQMGSDYDVDKLYSYMYNYFMDGDVIKKVASNEDNVESWQNALIDIHRAIFTSSDDNIVNAVLEPLSFSDVEEAIDELGAEGGSNFLGAFDTLYQRDVYFSNIMGKAGTAISANANTSHALAQASNMFIKGQGVVFMNEDGEVYQDHSGTNDTNRVNEFKEDTYWLEEVDDKGDPIDQNKRPGTGAWRLDKVFTFTKNPKTGKPYKISNLISQILGVSVDNAKEQKLGAFGLNRHNFNTSLAIIRSGFDLIHTKAFINQPILKDYYERIGEADDMYRVDYTPGKKAKIVQDMFKYYGEVNGIPREQFEELRVKESITGFKLSELKESLQKGKVDETNVIQQLEILKAFLYYKTIADSLQSITSTFNVDVQGLPKNVSETDNKDKEIQAALQENPLLGNIQKYATTTIPGQFLELAALNTKIFMSESNPIFLYRSSAYEQAMSDIHVGLGKADLKQEEIDVIHNNIKQFVYSGFAFPDERNIHEERMRLVFDTEDNQSLQTRFLELKAKYPNNELLNAIDPLTSIYPNDPKQLEIQMSNEDDYVQRVSEYWTHMLYNSDEPDLQTFAQDLVKYALYVAPKEYGTSNIVKYVPGEYLEDIGFFKYLHDINTRATYDSEILQYFVRQFAQHNPELLYTARERRDMIAGSIEHSGKDMIEAFSLPKIDPDELQNNPKGAALIKQIGDKLVYPNYLAVHINDSIGKQVYEKTETADIVRYDRIDRLDSGNMSQYTMGLRSVPNLVVSNIAVDEASNTSDAIINAINESRAFLTDKKRNVEYLVNGANPDDMLDSMITMDTHIVSNPGATQDNIRYAQLYKWLAKELQYKGLANTKVTVDINNPTAATTDISGKNIVFNPLKIKKGRTGLSVELEKQRTILHEFIHARVFQELAKGRSSSKEYKNIETLWNEYRKNIRETSKEEVRGIPVDVFDAELFSVLKFSFDRDRANNTDTTRGGFTAYVNHIVADPTELTKVVEQLGNALQVLQDQGEIAKRNYNLTSNPERLEAFRRHIVSRFLPNLAEMTNKYYAYYSPQEFITESMTNKQTQDILRQMPSLFQKLVTAIRELIHKIFGVEGEQQTLLDDALNAVLEFLNTDGNDVTLPPGVGPMEPVIVYQGYRTSNPDSREFNYFSQTEGEARQYGHNVRAVKVELKNGLAREYKDNERYDDEVREYKKQSGNRFDILDNSPEGMKVQEGFFKFLKNKGYDGLTMIHVNGKVIKRDENPYIVTFYPVEELPQNSSVKRINLQMQADNIVKIFNGTKSTTIRSERQAAEIGLKPGESGLWVMNGRDYTVTNRGYLTIDQAGGKNNMIKSEGLTSEDEFKYQQSKDWVNGKGKLYVYDITPGTPIQVQGNLFDDMTPEDTIETLVALGIIKKKCK